MGAGKSHRHADGGVPTRYRQVRNRGVRPGGGAATPGACVRLQAAEHAALHGHLPQPFCSQGTRPASCATPQVGNAVAPPMAAALGRCLLLAVAAEGRTPQHDQPIISVPDPELAAVRGEGGGGGVSQAGALLGRRLEGRLQRSTQHSTAQHCAAPLLPAPPCLQPCTQPAPSPLPRRSRRRARAASSRTRRSTASTAPRWARCWPA